MAASPWGEKSTPSNPNGRTLPTWLDPKDVHGDIQFILLKPKTETSKLPSNPFVISKSVDQLVGKIHGAHPIDDGKNYLLKVRNPNQVGKLLQLSKLIDGTPVATEMHQTLNYTKCVVTCSDVAGISDKDLAEELADQNVTCVYRFVRKVEGKEVPTNSFLLTIKGTTRPTHIMFGYIRVATRAYYPRPLMCLCCGKYGHTKLRCKQGKEPTCLSCGEKPYHEKCNNPLHCINCDGSHHASNRNCPKFQEEQEIVRLRVDLNISQADAVKEYKSRNLAAQPTNNVQKRLETARISSSIADKDLRIQHLEQQVAALIAEIRKLRSQNESENESTLEESDDSMDTSDQSSVLSKRQRVSGSSEESLSQGC
ncbi:uncharacterized protein LOC129752482 [Uranotaenia lowii]|uniref:uncharacterized protein LOC129752482 n=1 Tax=Uranotaenia lowii TaxID=190385 RepID=UPI0024799103|nr:uncharacterized protein LOC129752482 [Uranotaenia lowii]